VPKNATFVAHGPGSSLRSTKSTPWSVRTANQP
jgi:hypothetical protein